jgi:hypothetical protein
MYLELKHRCSNPLQWFRGIHKHIVLKNTLISTLVLGQFQTTRKETEPRIPDPPGPYAMMAVWNRELLKCTKLNILTSKSGRD